MRQQVKPFRETTFFPILAGRQYFEDLIAQLCDGDRQAIKRDALLKMVTLEYMQHVRGLLDGPVSYRS